MLSYVFWRLATGDWRLATGDWRLATGDWRVRSSFTPAWTPGYAWVMVVLAEAYATRMAVGTERLTSGCVSETTTSPEVVVLWPPPYLRRAVKL